MSKRTTAKADELVSATEVAAMLGVKPGAVHSYRARGYLPEPFVTLGCGAIWLRADIEKWNAQRPGKAWRRAA